MNQLIKTNDKYIDMDNAEIKLLPIVSPDAYSSAIKIFNEWANGRTINIGLILEYLHEKQKFYKPSTISTSKYALKKSIKQIMSMGARKIDIALLDEAFKEIKTGRRDPKIYSHRLPEKKLVFECIKKSDERTGLFIETLFYTGMRVSELLDIKLSDCSTDKKYVYITITGKGRKVREIFIPVKLFKKISKVFHGLEYLFETKKQKRYCRQVVWANIKKAGNLVERLDFHPHMFRHVCATYLLNELNMSLKSVSVFLGHASISITADTYHHDMIKPDDIFGKGK